MRLPLTQEEIATRLNRLEQQVELGLATKAEFRDLRKRLFEEFEALQSVVADVKSKGTPETLARQVAYCVTTLQKLEIRLGESGRF